MKRVKIGLVLVMALLVVGLTGCGMSKEAQREKIMKEYATTFFENHMIGIEAEDDLDVIVAQVKISMFKQVNELNLDEKYDLSKLSTCTDDSYVDLTINQENQQIEKYEFNLVCE